MRVAKVFVPQVEDGWMRHDSVSTSTTGPEEADTDVDTHRSHDGSSAAGEKEVAQRLAQARRSFILDRDPVAAYAHLQPLCVHCPSWRQRREVEDCAVELLLESNTTTELLKWLPDDDNDGRGSPQQSKLYKPNRAFLLRGLSHKEFHGTLTSADIGQRADTFSRLAEAGRRAAAPNEGGGPRPIWEMSLCSVVELLSALQRKPLRRDVFLWKQLSNVLLRCSEVAALPHEGGGDVQLPLPALVGTALAQYIVKVVVPCLISRDRPVDADARSYVRTRHLLDEQNLLQHAGEPLQTYYRRWVDNVFSSARRLEDSGDLAAAARGGEQSTESVVYDAMEDVMVHRRDVLDPSPLASTGTRSAPTTPRGGGDALPSQETPLHLSSTAADESPADDMRRNEAAVASAHFVTSQLLLMACGGCDGLTLSSLSVVQPLADRIAATLANSSGGGGNPSSPLTVVYAVVFRAVWIYFTPNMEHVFGQPRYIPPPGAATQSTTATDDDGVASEE